MNAQSCPKPPPLKPHKGFVTAWQDVEDNISNPSPASGSQSGCGSLSACETEGLLQRVQLTPHSLDLVRLLGQCGLDQTPPNQRKRTASTGSTDLNRGCLGPSPASDFSMRFASFSSTESFHKTCLPKPFSPLLNIPWFCPRYARPHQQV